jgi:hypothetical protein
MAMPELRRLGWVGLAVALLIAAGALLPVPPTLLRAQLDSSFAAALHYNAATGATVGSQTISTFGPLGFVFYDLYMPQTFVWLLLVRFGLAAVTCWALAWLGLAVWQSPWMAALAIAASAPWLASPDVWFLTLPFLAVLLELPQRRAPQALAIALGAAIGVVSLVKFSCLVAAAGILLPLAFADVAERRVPSTTLAALAAAALGWVAAQQPLGQVIAWLSVSMREITAGYASAMQLPADSALLVHAAIVTVAVLGLAWPLLRGHTRFLRWAGWLAIAETLYVLVRAGLVRADVHAYITVFGLLIVALWMALTLGRRRAAALALAVAGLGAGGLWLHATLTLGPPRAYFAPIYTLSALARLSMLPIVLTGNELDDADAQARADVRGTNPLPALQGTVDVYPSEQALLLAHGLDYHPRPVFQSYMAYTPPLEAANAAALDGPGAPDWILFHIRPIDDRLPALDDATSWPVLLARYRFAGAAGDFAVLQKQPRARRWRLEPLARRDAQTGEPIALPDDAQAPLWLRLSMQEDGRDRIAAALLEAPRTWINLTLADGSTRRYRLIPALAREGFVVSPLISNTPELATLWSPDAASRPPLAVTSFTVEREAALGVDDAPRSLTVDLSRLVVD